tara:strand:+ start:23963 stop:24166 length:204 start_codon:yes stop_codon:yes gene_type:complete
MDKNEIKKALYKQKPTAQLEFIRKGVAYYYTQLKDGDFIKFQVPVNDMGDADFYTEMEAKLLNRWIQ